MRKLNFKYQLVILLTCYNVGLKAQSLTFNHDASKMNQFLVGEEGTGDLQPAVYYTLLHPSYYKTAVGTGKLSYRTLVMAEGLYQKPMADSIKRLLESRAEIEALNVADRQVILDLEWAIEGEKITSALTKYKNSIEKILTVGNASYQTYWEDKYNCFNFLIDIARESYMPNAERKKVYLSIYEDIDKANGLIEKFIVFLKYKKVQKELLGEPKTIEHHNKELASSAFSAWRDAIGIATSGSSTPLSFSHTK